jgi:hypothetical protein
MVTDPAIARIGDPLFRRLARHPESRGSPGTVQLWRVALPSPHVLVLLEIRGVRFAVNPTAAHFSVESTNATQTAAVPF